MLKILNSRQGKIIATQRTLKPSRKLKLSHFLCVEFYHFWCPPKYVHRVPWFPLPMQLKKFKIQNIIIGFFVKKCRYTYCNIYLSFHKRVTHYVHTSLPSFFYVSNIGYCNIGYCILAQL